MADDALDAHDGMTPLKAKKPAMDGLAEPGMLGSVKNLSRRSGAGSDTLYCPYSDAIERYYFGRAPLEAAAQGIR